MDDNTILEEGCCITPNNGEEHEQESDTEISVKQDENSIELQYDGDLSQDQILAAEAYSVLFSLGGYTYTNLVEEGVMEAVSVVEEGEEEANYDDVDGDDNTGSNSKVDEEELIKTKSPYEQKFIREHRSLFSKTLNPKRYMHCPPMKIRLKQALSSRLDPSLYCFKPCAIPMHIKTEAKQLLDDLVAQGIIRRLEPNETSDVYAQAGFVPKKSKK